MGFTVGLIPRESGELIGLLIAGGVVADDVDTFALALKVDWKTREFAMSKSKDFGSYMTPVQVPVGDVAPLLRSEIVPQNVKTAVLAKSAEFAADADRATLTALAQYALGRGEPVAAAELTRWALARVDAQLIVRLLGKLLPQIRRPNWHLYFRPRRRLCCGVHSQWKAAKAREHCFESGACRTS